MTDTALTTMIEARNLSKYYGSFVAIENISFTIPKGQIVAFLGPNGAGKSTTMKILSGFLAPSKGTARVAGFDVGENRIEVARRLGYLPENGPLYDNMTPLEMLRFLGEARGITGQHLIKRIDAVDDICALQLVLEKPIGKLSRGYRQRVGLAQALLHEPDVLIMDEPTSGLDPNQIRDFRSNIRNLAKETTILLSTHILQEVEAVAERVLLVHNGRLQFDGTPRELAGSATLEETFHRMTSASTAPHAVAEGGAADET